MAKDNTDILLDADDDDLIANGDDVIGDCIKDDCFIIFKLNTGVLKSDPVLGPNLVMLINSNKGSGEIQKSLRINLERDNKKYKKLDVNNGLIDFEI